MKLLIFILPMIVSAMAAEEADKKSYDLISASGAFSAKMFQNYAQSRRGASVVMSGVSALSPLAQLGLAASGETHDEILKAINMPNNEAVTTAFSGLISNLRSVKGINLQVASRVYVPSDVTLNKTFVQISRDVFGSDVKTVDFSAGHQAASTINKWVEDQTNNLIKNLVSPQSLSADTQAVLVNAIYFKGKWKKAFHASQTTYNAFYVSKRKTIHVPTMKNNGYFMYGESAELDAQLLVLPYEGNQASLLIVLPKKIEGIKELQKKLADPSILSQAKSHMYYTEVNVYLPKFKIKTTIDLTQVLKNIGVKTLFDPRTARLDYLLEKEKEKEKEKKYFYVSDAIQKVFIEVNEEGTKAAAASAYQVRALKASLHSVKKPNPKIFKADKPFYFELRTTVPIFVGSYKG